MDFDSHKQWTMGNLASSKYLVFKCKERCFIPSIVWGCLVSGLEEQK
jgi:hypothetical protein